MTDYCLELAIDFGEVGYPSSKEPFKVRLDGAPLSQLIEDANKAYRVYELMLISRPGDVWDYVYVVPDVVPKRLVERLARARDEAKPKYSDNHPWPEGKIPIVIFNKFFFWSGDDTDPTDEAWLNQIESPVMASFAKQLIAVVEAGKARLTWSDHLLKHIARLIEMGKHDFDLLQRSAAIAADDSNGPAQEQHTPAFYKKLADQLRDRELVSVAYRADGDYRILRALATEQRRRAYLTGHSSRDALSVNALVNRTISNKAWDSKILFYSEGLGHGDLFIQGKGMNTNPIKTLIEDYSRFAPGRHILSWRDEGDIKGYTKESGDGWWLYQKELPDNRRRCLARARSDRGSHLPVLAFNGDGNIVHSHEKTVFVVGPQVSQHSLAVLADIICDWKSIGNQPLVISLGDSSVLENIGCARVVQAPAFGDAPDEDERSWWLHSLLDDQFDWLDVIVLLDAPEWLQESMSWVVERADGPWKKWVVATPGTNKLQADFTLADDFSHEIALAHQRALRLRPKQL